jgi:maleate isomerase
MNNAFMSSQVSSGFTLDHGPGLHRIGLIVLANDYATERDFINVKPSDDVALFVSRVENASSCTVETLPLMAPHIAKAAELVIPDGRLDVMAYSCTSGTVVMGYEKICALIHSARPGIPVVTPITASLAALDLFDAQKLAVLTPYTDDVNSTIVDYLEFHKKTVCSFTSFQIEDNEVMAKLSPEAILQGAIEADRPEAEALFISCTAIRALDVVEKIENVIGKPVVTANQALIWQALRISGCSDSVEGYVNLLRL